MANIYSMDTQGVDRYLNSSLNLEFGGYLDRLNNCADVSCTIDLSTLEDDPLFMTESDPADGAWARQSSTAHCMSFSPPISRSQLQACTPIDPRRKNRGELRSKVFKNCCHVVK